MIKTMIGMYAVTIVETIGWSDAIVNGVIITQRHATALALTEEADYSKGKDYLVQFHLVSYHFGRWPHVHY